MLGLLGPNGSGKTTTIRCITGEEAVEHGRIVVDTSARGQGAYVGLCPQETVLNTDLTVEENLLFFAYVRGAFGSEAKTYVSEILGAICMEEKKHWFPDTLSGGMKRRLAVGCAMIAQPLLTILDEPTTGLDPVSRRGIWSTISDIRAKGGCCLLTTHMLEEAETLATQIVVLRKGDVLAKGTVQSLKDRWGEGYMLSLDTARDEVEKAITYVSSLLPEQDRKPIRTTEHGQCTFKLSCSGEALGHLIIKLAQGQNNNGIRHWGLSQASLEDTYLRIIDSTAGECAEASAV